MLLRESGVRGLRGGAEDEHNARGVGLKALVEAEDLTGRRSGLG